MLNRSYELLAREIGFEVDPCRSRMGQDKSKAERSVRTLRNHFGELFSREWTELEPLQVALDKRAARTNRWTIERSKSAGTSGRPCPPPCGRLAFE